MILAMDSAPCPPSPQTTILKGSAISVLPYGVDLGERVLEEVERLPRVLHRPPVQRARREDLDEREAFAGDMELERLLHELAERELARRDAAGDEGVRIDVPDHLRAL